MRVMLRPGLVSITYRALAPREIIELCQQTHLEGIEWGADVHVPPGDETISREVAQLTTEAGLETVCYGSYYRCDGQGFEAVLDTALHLGAPLIRVWAGDKGSAQSDEENLKRIADDLARISTLAAPHGITIATEYHGGTLTDTRESCARLHEEASHPNLKTLWQPLRRAVGDAKTEENSDDLRAVLSFLSNVHVYHWIETNEGRKALPLAQDQSWQDYIEILRGIGQNRWLLLEFVPDNIPEILAGEAATLRNLLAE
jgi:sugar phosphate isomerase/epimerase